MKSLPFQIRLDLIQTDPPWRTCSPRTLWGSDAFVGTQTVQHLFEDIVTSWTADLHVFQLLRVGINSDVLNFSILELVILKL